MHLVARVRWTLARHPSLYWLAIAVCALTAAVSVHRAGRDAAETRLRWGTLVDAVVADAPIERGQSLTVSLRQVPVAMLPDGALSEMPDTDTVAARPIAANAIVTDVDLASSAIPGEWVTISIAAVSPPLVAGDQVAVIAGGALLCDGIAAGAVVDDRVDIAVPASCALRASEAAITGDLMLGRRG